MPHSGLTYAITDRLRCAGDEAARELALTEQTRRLLDRGVDFLQIREKDLLEPQLRRLAERLRSVVPFGSRPRLLLNGPAETAHAAAMDGVHLPGGWGREAVAEARRTLERDTGMERRRDGRVWISVAAHSVEEAVAAGEAGADLVLFGPVFEKRGRDGRSVAPGLGIPSLKEAAGASRAAVLALGGVTEENRAECLAAGAAGVAAIRLFR